MAHAPVSYDRISAKRGFVLPILSFFVNQSVGAWEYDHAECSIGFCDDYWRRRVTNYYADEREVASVGIFSQSVTASPAAIAESEIFLYETGYIEHWNLEFINNYDDHGKNQVFRNERLYEGAFIASVLLDAASLRFLELDGLLPFHLGSQLGDFIVSNASLTVDYRYVPEPSSFELMLSCSGLLLLRLMRNQAKRV